MDKVEVRFSLLFQFIERTISLAEDIVLCEVVLSYVSKKSQCHESYLNFPFKL